MATTISGSGGVTFPNASTATVGGVGDGQTWQNVAASRVLGTTYTNSTGKPIAISFNASGTTLATLVIDGVTVQKAQAVASSWMPISAIIPNGSTYSITGGGGINVWVELR